MQISIVTTMYHSSNYLQEFYDRVKSSVEKITSDYEIIFVNDGSPDNSLSVVQQLIKINPKVRAINLSRNFGHHKAMVTGLQQSKGEYIFLIDCDLEEAPELLVQFWNTMQTSQQSHSEKLDLVYGVQNKRKGGWFERISGGFFFKVINFLSEFQVVSNQLTARLMTRRFVDNILTFKEQELVFFGIDAMTGYNRQAIYVTKQHKGSTVYTLSKRLKLAIQFITALSAKPLMYIFYLGSFVTFISILFFIYLIIKKIFFGVELMGWTSVIASIWLFGGLLIFCLGVLGIYISVIFSEVKNRPFTIIQDQYPSIENKD